MDIVTDIEGAFERVEAHIKTLVDGGAPHQQAHAKDLQTVLDMKGVVTPARAAASYATLSAELDAATGKIANLQGNLDNLLTVRDSLQSQLDAANAEIATLKAASPLSVAAVPVGGRIASGTTALASVVQSGTVDPSTNAAAGTIDPSANTAVKPQSE